MPLETKPVSMRHFKNYLVYRNDRQDSRGVGVALVVYRSVKRILRYIENTLEIENLSIETEINNKKLAVSIAYSPKYKNSFSNIIKLTSQLEDFIIMGDFNTKHSS